MSDCHTLWTQNYTDPNLNTAEATALVRQTVVTLNSPVLTANTSGSVEKGRRVIALLQLVQALIVGAVDCLREVWFENVELGYVSFCVETGSPPLAQVVVVEGVHQRPDVSFGDRVAPAARGNSVQESVAESRVGRIRSIAVGQLGLHVESEEKTTKATYQYTSGEMIPTHDDGRSCDAKHASVDSLVEIQRRLLLNLISSIHTTISPLFLLFDVYLVPFPLNIHIPASFKLLTFLRISSVLADVIP